MTPWERLVERIPMDAAEALVRELEAKSDAHVTGQVALVLHLRDGRILSWRTAEVKAIASVLLT